MLRSLALRTGVRRAFSNDALSREIPTVKLAYDRWDPKSPSTKQPLVFLHGLFGSKINNKTVSKVLARDLGRQVYCLDLRNHGESEHNNRHDYPALAADVEAFLDSHEIPESIVIGHSMGAKTAMAVALRRPELVHALVPVDNAPIDARLTSNFGEYVKAMKKIAHTEITQSKQAYEIMNRYEPNIGIQQFLLANLKKQPETGLYKFRVPLDILGKTLDQLGEFPYLPSQSRFVKPTMFIRGTESHYIADDALPVTGQFFPSFTLKDVKCGHWVISEKPQEFLTYTKEFINDLEDD